MLGAAMVGQDGFDRVLFLGSWMLVRRLVHFSNHVTSVPRASRPFCPLLLTLTMKLRILVRAGEWVVAPDKTLKFAPSDGEVLPSPIGPPQCGCPSSCGMYAR